MNNYFDRFTNEAKRAVIIAEEEARDEQVGYIGTEHILLGILHQENTPGNVVLQSFGVSLKNVKLVIQQSSQNRKPTGAPKFPQSIELSDFAKKAIEDAVAAGHQYHHTYIGTEHLLMGLMMQKGTAATVILENMKISPDSIKARIEDMFRQNSSMMGSNVSPASLLHPLEKMLSSLSGVIFSINPNNEMKEAYKHKDGEQGQGESQSKTPALDFFTVDITAEARAGKLDPIIGRDKEVERVVHILNRKTKNNPVLLGEPGVGKTAIIEGIAQKIVEEKVPSTLLDKRILSLDMASMIAGTKYRGEFEARIKQVIDEAMKLENEVILFIDEIHTLVGAGSAEGSLDAANILKPALGRGKIQLIGATTIKEYRKNIEKDSALERRFQTVNIEEPSEEDTVKILQGLKSTFEEYHNLVVDDSAVDAAVRLSKRYINDRYLPDKAIDVLDEAMALESVKGNHGNQKQRKKLKDQMAKIVQDKEVAVASQKYEEAAKLREAELVIEEKLKSIKSQNVVPKEKRKHVTEEHINKIIASMTGVPMTKLVEHEVRSLKNLEKTLGSHIIGQNDAITAISKAIRRNRAGVANPDRPIGSFLFLGPSGVGKTELVKVLAKEVYGRKDALIKIDMSEFMEKHNVSRLTGATPGYVGHEEGGQLTEMVHQKPYSIILFDEIEKAHPEVFNILLQIMEDGRLTDGKGRVVDFRNTIIVMTSNLGAEKFNSEALKIGFNLSHAELKKEEHDFEEVKTEITKSLEDSFRPELLNRIDKVVIFRPLNKEDIAQIVKLEVARLQERLSLKKFELDISKNAYELLTQKSYNPKDGARGVRKTIQDMLEDPFTEKLIDGEITESSHIKVSKDKKKEELVFVTNQKND